MKSKSAMDEVEELLKAAEDEMVLKLKVDSHMSRSSPSYLEPDLEHRFQALKKPSSSSSKTNKPVSNSQLPQPSPQRTITDAKSVQSFQDDDDLYARFAALKGTSSSSSIPPTRSDSGGVQIDPSNGKKNDDEDDVDEVEKIIQWAIDAARLDPSPPTDDEDDGDDDSEDDDDDDDDSEDERVKGSKKGKKV